MENKPWNFGNDDYSLLLNGMTTANLSLGWEDGDVKIIELTKKQFEMILQILGLETRGSEWTEDGQRHRQFVAYTDDVLDRIDEKIYASKAISKAVKMTPEEIMDLSGKGADPDDLI